MSTITHDHEYTNKQKDMDKFNLIPQTIVSSSIIQELKRLQLEINKSNKVQEDAVVDGWFNHGSNTIEKNNKAIERIESNTARIAQIILNEL